MGCGTKADIQHGTLQELLYPDIRISAGPFFGEQTTPYLQRKRTMYILSNILEVSPFHAMVFAISKRSGPDQ